MMAVFDTDRTPPPMTVVEALGVENEARARIVEPGAKGYVQLPTNPVEDPPSTGVHALDSTRPVERVVSIQAAQRDVVVALRLSEALNDVL